MSDPLCVCGHRASNHATPDSDDTRCLAVEAREDLLSVFDDGRDGGLRLLRLPALHPRPTDPATGGLMPLRATRTLGSEGANFGLRPVIDPAVRALTRGRVRHVDAAYKRPETMSAANARFIACQAEVPIVERWGGGMVVSVDGLRFVVPVKSLWAGPNPRYFGLRHRGATWLCLLYTSPSPRDRS